LSLSQEKNMSIEVQSITWTPAGGVVATFTLDAGVSGMPSATVGGKSMNVTQSNGVWTAKLNDSTLTSPATLAITINSKVVTSSVQISVAMDDPLAPEDTPPQ
jgi:hypothetical protein